VASPFSGGVDLANADPKKYSHAVFVCGPFMPNTHERALAERFKSCKLIGVNLSLPVPLADWNPFDLLFERDSDRISRPDITFAASQARVPVIGVCLVESYDGARTAGGFRIKRQAEALEWPAVFTVDDLDDARLSAALDYCLTEAARRKAIECRDRAVRQVQELKRAFVEAISPS
jgi:hypothetical protein